MWRQVRGIPRAPISRHLVRRFGGERPEVPLHVGVAQVVGRETFLGADEVLELHRIAKEEDRGVVAHDVEVSLGRVELDGKPPRVTPRVRGAAERATALGARLALSDALPVEGGHLLDQVEVLEQDGAVRTDGERVLLAGDGDACIRRRGWAAVGLLGHVVSCRRPATTSLRSSGGGMSLAPLTAGTGCPVPAVGLDCSIANC
jgi:hypothetical protein